MMEYTRRLIFGTALLTVAVMSWYVGHRLLEFAEAMIDRVGPIWSLMILGVLTVGLGATWMRYGGPGALGRWGVTIRPAVPLEPAPDDLEDGFTPHVPGTPARPERDQH